MTTTEQLADWIQLGSDQPRVCVPKGCTLGIHITHPYMIYKAGVLGLAFIGKIGNAQAAYEIVKPLMMPGCTELDKKYMPALVNVSKDFGQLLEDFYQGGMLVEEIIRMLRKGIL